MVKRPVFISALSFASYVLARLVGPGIARRRRDGLERLRNLAAALTEAA